MTVTARALCLVSIDGLGASALDDPALDLPALRGLAARGARSDGLRPSFPSVTWPCHTTLVTGVRPARHGILGNHVFDREQRTFVSHYGDQSGMRPRAETLYDAAATAGLRTAAVCWPLTSGAARLGDNIPEFYEQDLFERHATRPLWDELRASGLPIDRYGEWSTQHPLGPLQDRLTLEVARHLLQRRPPDLLLVHFLVADSFQHDYGVDSAEARWALEYVDGLVGRLLDELAALGRLETTDVVVVGDHGFTPADRLVLPNADLHADGLLDLDGQGTILGHRARVAANGGAAHVYVEDGPRRDALVARVRERFTGAPGIALVLGPETFLDVGLPRPCDDATQGDLVLVAADGWYFGGHATAEAAAAAPRYRGMHGQLPDDPRLRAGFVAAGPGIAEGVRIGNLDHLDVAPTLAALLGVKLVDAERAPVRALLRR
jgi:predicted AlkP superfamily pyrophosphatase or phosphodiesterase